MLEQTTSGGSQAPQLYDLQPISWSTTGGLHGWGLSQLSQLALGGRKPGSRCSLPGTGEAIPSPLEDDNRTDCDGRAGGWLTFLVRAVHRRSRLRSWLWGRWAWLELAWSEGPHPGGLGESPLVVGLQTPLSLSSPISSTLPKRQPAGSHQDLICPQLEDCTTLPANCPPCKGPCEGGHPSGPTASGSFPWCCTSCPRDLSGSPRDISLWEWTGPQLGVGRL